MAQADVSAEALSKIKSSLKKFQEANLGFGGRISLLASERITSCNNTLNSVFTQISQLEAEVKQLSAQIQQLEEQIAQKDHEKKSLQNSLPSLEQKLRSTEQQISSLNGQLRALQAQLSQTEDPDQKDVILAKIESVNSQLRVAERQQEELKQAIADAQARISALESEIAQLKTEKMRCEGVRDEKTRQLHRLRSKYEKLKSAFSAVSSELQALTSASKSFESSASESMERSTGNIDRCIAYINDYMSVNL